MSERMTPEREREIRWELDGPEHIEFARDMKHMLMDAVAELDAVRADLAIHLKSSNDAGAALVQAWRERDEARAELEQAKANAETNAKLLDELYPRLAEERSRREAAEADAMQARKEHHRLGAWVDCPTCTRYFNADHTAAVEALRDEQRIEALEAALRDALDYSGAAVHRSGCPNGIDSQRFTRAIKITTCPGCAGEALLSPGEKPPTPEPSK